jgi:hypothetical protein
MNEPTITSTLDRPPNLDVDQVPPEEFNALWHIMKALRQIMQHTEEFAAALRLFDFCTSEMERGKNGQDASNLPLHAWRLMAGRDAGMSIYHFGMTIVTVYNFAD